MYFTGLFTPVPLFKRVFRGLLHDTFVSDSLHVQHYVNKTLTLQPCPSRIFYEWDCTHKHNQQVHQRANGFRQKQATWEKTIKQRRRDSARVAEWWSRQLGYAPHPWRLPTKIDGNLLVTTWLTPQFYGSRLIYVPSKAGSWHLAELIDLSWSAQSLPDPQGKEDTWRLIV